jgi:steroid 5-alpha reductase family enzyme
MMEALVIAVSLSLVVAMTIAWLIQRRTSNAGWVDVVWSFALGAAGVIYALYPLHTGMPSARQFLIAALAAFWSLRLGLHIAARTVHGSEDSRYAQFRRDWGGTFQRRMFWFLQIQATVAALLALSMLLVARNPRSLSVPDAAAGAVLLVSIVGEAIADRQLRRFRSDPANHGRICEVGLWGWSRHPNYFFEFLGWVAYPLFAIDAQGGNPWGGYPWGWLAISAPVFMYWLLVHVSGIPPLEQQMLRSRGDAFRNYQARVSAFIPLPPVRPS